MRTNPMTLAALAAAALLLAPRLSPAAEEPAPAAAPAAAPADAKPADTAPAKPADVKPPEPAAQPEPPKAEPAKPADPMSPVGRWKTIDDSTGKTKSIVELWEKDGKVYGKIVDLINPDKPDPVCDKCEGDQKNVKIIGMTILNGLKKDGKEWSGGKITDPENGKSYKCYIEVQDGGKKLKVRGYVGFALLGRTQYWLREQ